MPRSAYLLVTVCACGVAAGCVDLSRPDQLLRMADGGVTTDSDRSDAREAGSTRTELDAAEDAAAPDASSYAPPTGPDVAEPRDGLAGVDRPASVDLRPGDAAPESGVLAPDVASGTPDSQPDLLATVVDAPLTSDRGLPDRAPPPRPLLIDDFADGNGALNLLGADVIFDHQVPTLARGELSFVWDRSNIRDGQAFAQNLKAGGCPVDLGSYRTLSFRMRASVANKVVFLVLANADAACMLVNPTIEIGSVLLSTTMTTYTISLVDFKRDATRFFQWVPDPDNTRYFIDDIQLLP
jgi:hypothetical protein